MSCTICRVCQVTITNFEIGGTSVYTLVIRGLGELNLPYDRKFTVTTNKDLNSATVLVCKFKIVFTLLLVATKYSSKKKVTTNIALYYCRCSFLVTIS